MITDILSSYNSYMNNTFGGNEMRKTLTIVSLVLTMVNADGLENNFNNTPLGTVDVNITGLGAINQTVTALRFKDVDVIQGDIVVGENTTNSLRSNTIHQLGESRRWDGGVIPYVIDDTISDSKREVILTAMSDWESRTTIRFQEVSNRNAHSPRYLFFFKDNSNACQSYVGKTGDYGMQKIWIADWCGLGGITHELGHVLGLYHEQSRSDRDDYIDVNYDNVKDDYRYSFRKILRVDVGHGTEYNYNSLMHYGGYAATKNGLPTMVAHDGSRLGNHKIDDGDVDAVNFLYSDKIAYLDKIPNTVYGDTVTITWSDTPNSIYLTVYVQDDNTFFYIYSGQIYGNSISVSGLPMYGSTVRVNIKTFTDEYRDSADSRTFKSLH